MGFNALTKTFLQEWGKLSEALACGSLRKTIITLNEEEMPVLPWKIIEGRTKRLREVGMLEWIYFKRPEDPELHSK